MFTKIMLIFQLLDLERRLIWQKICFMKKCYFSLNQPPIWWAVYWKNLKCYLLCISSTSILYTILPSQIGRCLLTLHTSVWKIERCISIVPFDIFYKRSRDRKKQFDKSCINIPMIILVHWMWKYYIMHSIKVTNI